MEMWQVKVEVRSMPTTAHEYVLTPGPKFAVLKYYFHREPVARFVTSFMFGNISQIPAYSSENLAVDLTRGMGHGSLTCSSVRGDPTFEVQPLDKHLYIPSLFFIAR